MQDLTPFTYRKSYGRQWTLVSVSTAALLLASCGSGSGSARSNVGRRHRDACLHAASRTAGGSRRPTVLRGDVDADGTPDTVSVVVRSMAPPQCRYLLSVTSAVKRWETPVEQEGTEGGGAVPATWDMLRLPDVNALIRLPGSS